MRQDILMISDAAIDKAELVELLKSCGYLALSTDSVIKVWESGTDSNDEVELECGSTDFYRYEDDELLAIKAIVSNPQLIYVSYRNKPLAERIVSLIESKYVSVVDDDHGSLTFKGEKLVP